MKKYFGTIEKTLLLKMVCWPSPQLIRCFTAAINMVVQKGKVQRTAAYLCSDPVMGQRQSTIKANEGWLVYAKGLAHILEVSVFK